MAVKHRRKLMIIAACILVVLFAGVIVAIMSGHSIPSPRLVTQNGVVVETINDKEYVIDVQEAHEVSARTVTVSFAADEGVKRNLQIGDEVEFSYFSDDSKLTDSGTHITSAHIEKINYAKD